MGNNNDLDDADQSILDRAFNGPSTSDAPVERTSWLEKTAAAPPSGSDRPSVVDVNHRTTATRRSSLALLAVGAVVLLALALVGAFVLWPSDETQLAAETQEEPLPDQGAVDETPATTLAVDDQPVDLEDANPTGGADEVSQSTVVEYSTGVSTVDPDQRVQLTLFLEQLAETSDVVVVGAGDPSNDANEPLNAALGRYRAETVADVLFELGLPENRLVVASGIQNGPNAGTVLVLPLDRS